MAHCIEDRVITAGCQRIENRWIHTQDHAVSNLTAEEELRVIRTHAEQFRRPNSSYFGDGDISRSEFRLRSQATPRPPRP